MNKVEPASFKLNLAMYKLYRKNFNEYSRILGNTTHSYLETTVEPAIYCFKLIGQIITAILELSVATSLSDGIDLVETIFKYRNDFFTCTGWYENSDDGLIDNTRAGLNTIYSIAVHDFVSNNEKYLQKIKLVSTNDTTSEFPTNCPWRLGELVDDTIRNIISTLKEKQNK